MVDFPDPGAVSQGRIPEGRSGVNSFESGINGEAVERKEIREVYRIHTGSRNISTQEVMAAVDLPKLGTPYDQGTEFDRRMHLADIAPRQVPGTDNVWDVELTWSLDAPKERRAPATPIDLLAQVNISFEEHTIPVIGIPRQGTIADPVQYYESGSKLVASNGEPYDPPAEYETSWLDITIERNEKFEGFDKFIEKLTRFHNTINKEPFLGRFPNTFRLRIEARRDQENGVLFWLVRYHLTFRPDSWDYVRVDEGTFELINSDKIPIKDDEGNGIRALLDNAGKQLPVGIDPQFNRHDIYVKENFSELDLEAELDRVVF